MSTIPTAARSSVQMTTYPIDALQHVTMIHVGRQTETGVECIRFDCAAWLSRWPGMELSVWPTAPGADTAYEAQTHMDGNVIVWDVSGSDTITPGKGYVEVLGMVDGRRKLSARAQTMVIASGLAATADPPESQQPWYERAMGAVEGVPEVVAKELQEAKDSGVFDGEKGDPGPAGPAGATGADGISPTVRVEDIDGGHRVTITDKDGDKTFEVMDGAEGDYELIERYTLDETAVIWRYKEPNGERYKFVKMLILIDFPQTTAIYGTLSFNGVGYAILTPYLAFSGSKFVMYEIGIVNGYWRGAGTTWGTSDSNTITGQNITMQPRTFVSKKQSDIPYIDEITTGTTFPAGTTIEIWAVRA